MCLWLLRSIGPSQADSDLCSSRRSTQYQHYDGPEQGYVVCACLHTKCSDNWVVSCLSSQCMNLTSFATIHCSGAGVSLGVAPRKKFSSIQKLVVSRHTVTRHCSKMWRTSVSVVVTNPWGLKHHVRVTNLPQACSVKAFMNTLFLSLSLSLPLAAEVLPTSPPRAVRAAAVWQPTSIRRASGLHGLA